MPSTVPALQTVTAAATSATGTPGTAYPKIGYSTHGRSGLAPGFYSVLVETGLSCKASKAFTFL